MAVEHGNSSIIEARRLFRVLARINYLIFQANSHHDKRNPFLYEALSLIETNTENIQWRNEVASTLYSDVKHKDTEWEHSVLNGFNANIARARDSKDYIHLGNMYVRCGMYGEAFSAYTSSPESLVLNSHLHILQKSWQYIIISVGKAFISNKGSITPELMLNLAMAYWYTKDYRNCTAVLLHLDMNKIKDPRNESNVWLSYKNVRSMLIVCVLQQLSRENLEFFLAKDEVGKTIGASEIISAYISLDTTKFWDLVDKDLDLPISEDYEGPLRILGDNVHQNWLYVYNKVPLQDVLVEFRKGGVYSDYTEMDLIDDLCRWKAPYKVDSARQCVDHTEIRSDPSTLAETLAYEFERDSLLQLWKNRYQRSTLSI